MEKKCDLCELWPSSSHSQKKIILHQDTQSHMLQKHQKTQFKALDGKFYCIQSTHLTLSLCFQVTATYTLWPSFKKKVEDIRNCIDKIKPEYFEDFEELWVKFFQKGHKPIHHPNIKVLYESLNVINIDSGKKKVNQRFSTSLNKPKQKNKKMLNVWSCLLWVWYLHHIIKHL